MNPAGLVGLASSNSASTSYFTVTSIFDMYLGSFLRKVCMAHCCCMMIIVVTAYHKKEFSLQTCNLSQTLHGQKFSIKILPQIFSWFGKFLSILLHVPKQKYLYNPNFLPVVPVFYPTSLHLTKNIDLKKESIAMIS